MFFKSKKKKRIIAIKDLFKVWITSNIKILEMRHEKVDTFIKTSSLSIWYFIGASDSLTQREDLLNNEDFLELTEDVFLDMDFDMHVVSECIKSYVDNSWNDEEFEYLMLGGNACNRFLSVEKDQSGMFEYFEKIDEQIDS